SIASTPVTKNVAGTWYLSSIFRMRGTPLSAPKSDADKLVGDVVPSRRSGASVSVSKLRQTATFAFPGQLFGVSFRPTRASSIAWRSCSSVHLVPGWFPPCCCAVAVASATRQMADTSTGAAGRVIMPGAYSESSGGTVPRHRGHVVEAVGTRDDLNFE